MKPLKKFEEFIKLNIIKKQRKDIERSASLIKEAENKRAFLNKVLNNIPFEEIEPNYIIETCYDVLIEIIRAKLFSEGFNSSSSHEAEVSYMRNLGFSENDVRFMNELRYFRNGIKYYGKILNKEYAEKVLKFLNKIYTRLK